MGKPNKRKKRAKDKAKANRVRRNVSDYDKNKAARNRNSGVAAAAFRTAAMMGLFKPPDRGTCEVRTVLTADESEERGIITRLPDRTEIDTEKWNAYVGSSA